MGSTEMISDELQAAKGENLALGEGGDEVELPCNVGDEAQGTGSENSGLENRRR